MEDKLFHLKGSVAAYTKIKYTNQVTSNDGEIDLKMCESQFLASVTLTFSRSLTT